MTKLGTCELCGDQFDISKGFTHVCGTALVEVAQMSDWWELVVLLKGEAMASLLIEGEQAAAAAALSLYKPDKDGVVKVRGMQATPLVVNAFLVCKTCDIAGLIVRRAPHNVFLLDEGEVEIPSADSLTHEMETDNGKEEVA